MSGKYWDQVFASITPTQWAKARKEPAGIAAGAPSETVLDIDEFCERLAAEFGFPTGDVHPDAELVANLDLDSLSMVLLAELIDELAGPVELSMVGELTTVREAYRWHGHLQSPRGIPSRSRAVSG